MHEGHLYPLRYLARAGYKEQAWSKLLFLKGAFLAEADLHKSTPFDNWSKYSSAHPRPGRYDGEVNNQTSWCGVDCSGFIYNLTKASSKTYAIEALDKTNCGTSNLADDKYSTKYGDTETIVRLVNVGDIAVVSGDHVMMISRTASSKEDLFVIHADGYAAGRMIFEANFDLERHDYDESSLRKLK